MTYQLSRDEIDQFHFQGYLGPYTVLPSSEMAEIREELFTKVFNSDGPNPKDKTHSRHLDTPSVYKILSHPAIVERIASLIGEDVMLWSCGVFIKEPHGEGKATDWHQDIAFWPIEPPVNVTAWVAIEDVYEDNAPLQLIPGTHRRLLPHVKSTESLRIQVDPTAIDTSQAKAMTCKAGGFVLFSEKLVHGSDANNSARRRTGLVARYSMPMVRLFSDESPINFPKHHAIMVSGQDKFGFNRYGPGPK